MSPEFSLLLACTHPLTTRKEEDTIRRILDSGIDWTVFMQRAVNCRLAGFAGHNLARLAPDLAHPDILDALRFYLDQLRARNQLSFDGLAQLLEALTDKGIEAIPFKGPVLALQGYGDLGLSEFNDINLLIRDSDMASTMAAFSELGYEPFKKHLPESLRTSVQRFQGNDLVVKKNARNGFRLYTKLTPADMAFDIDYDGLWRRSKQISLGGRLIRTLPPEDVFIILAVHGGQERWRNIRWVCDVAAVASRDTVLDWDTVAGRARAQGCLQAVLLASSLARSFFDIAVPDFVDRAEKPGIKALADAIAAGWDSEANVKPAQIPTLYRMQLHDGILRRVRFLAKTILLKNPERAVAPERRDLSPGRKSNGVSSEPQGAEEWARQADNHLRLGRFAEASEASDRALAHDPQHIAATRIGIDARAFACDWRRREDDKRRISEGLKRGGRLVGPLNHRAICNSEAEHLLFAQLRAKDVPPAGPPLWSGAMYDHEKIRIAYISTDFRDHVLSSAIAGCFEHHDKTRFEITAVSIGQDDKSEMRQRIKRAVDRFIDAAAMSDVQIATMLRELEIDIAVDQNGYSGAGRTGIMAMRPAPVQVNYLAYPGTMGAPFIDYIIADRFLIPEKNRQFYTEQVAYLPHTYLPTDSQRPISDWMPNRVELGLPESGFVFVCNNNAHKIGPEIFGIWMRLLKAVEGSVLWLGALSPSAKGNLRREASAAGVAPTRLVFAHKIAKIDDHLARLRLGDLFLDTLPYNAHATASDALWAGLPVLTCLGDTFPACVAAAVLHAIGLPELATKTLAEYEELALALARDPERLSEIKSRLMRNRLTEPLFNTAQFTRDLESAYTMMFERQQAGLPPECFAVEPR